MRELTKWMPSSDHIVCRSCSVPRNSLSWMPDDLRKDCRTVLRQCGPCFNGASWRRVMKQSEAHVRSISGF